MSEPLRAAALEPGHHASGDERSANQRPHGVPAGHACRQPGDRKAQGCKAETVCVSPHAQPRNEKFFSETAGEASGGRLELLRREYESPARTGRTLHTAVWEVLQAHGPAWLQRAYFPGLALLLDADALKLDEAWTAPWPPNTQRGSEGRKRRARAECHAAVWDVFKADPSRPVDDGLYEAAALRVVGEDGKHPSDSTVRRRYREAVERGALDVKVLRS